MNGHQPSPLHSSTSGACANPFSLTRRLPPTPTRPCSPSHLRAVLQLSWQKRNHGYKLALNSSGLSFLWFPMEQSDNPRVKIFYQRSLDLKAQICSAWVSWVVGRKENRSYLTGFLHIKENARKITMSKTWERKESSGGSVQGRRTGHEGWVGGSGKKSRALIPGANEPMNAGHFPLLCSLRSARVLLYKVGLCVRAGLPFPGVTTNAP